MSEFYKMEPLRWDRGTDNLTLEQEAAYLRVCNAIYAADQPLAQNFRTLAGMWRCNERKAKRLLSELVDAGKLYVEAGWIKNDKVLGDVETRLELRVKRQLAGHSGGIESGKSRAKALKNNEPAQANGSTRKEVEENTVSKDTDASGVPSVSEALWTNGVSYLCRNGVKDRHARSLIGKWRKQSGDQALFNALASANRTGTPDPVAYITAALREPEDQKLNAWGIGDAQPLRTEPRAWDQDAEGGSGQADLPAVQRAQEASEPEDPMPLGDGETGRFGGPMLALRVVGGGAL